MGRKLAGLSAIRAPSCFGGGFPNLPRNDTFISNREYSKTNQLADGVANIGRRPTVNGDGEILEVFIFDFDQDIYMQKIKISLVEFIRTEVKFEKLETMVIAMKHDAEVAKSILAIK